LRLVASPTVVFDELLFLPEIAACARLLYLKNHRFKLQKVDRKLPEQRRLLIRRGPGLLKVSPGGLGPWGEVVSFDVAAQGTELQLEQHVACIRTEHATLRVYRSGACDSERSGRPCPHPWLAGLLQCGHDAREGHVEGFLHVFGRESAHLACELFEAVDIRQYPFGRLTSHGKLTRAQADAKLRAPRERAEWTRKTEAEVPRALASMQERHHTPRSTHTGSSFLVEQVCTTAQDEPNARA